jgi:hypothetical protein
MLDLPDWLLGGELFTHVAGAVLPGGNQDVNDLRRPTAR